MAGSSDAQALLLQVSADTSKAVKQLDTLSKKLSGVASDAEKSSKRASTSLDRFFGKTDPAKAFDKIFDSTRFKILDTGAARVGLFGSALESLGPAGLAAAAGIGAVAGAFAEALSGAKFFDELGDTADRLHVTTDALQEFQFAIRAAGGKEEGAAEALEAFSANLGKAQEGLVKGQRAFLALGFTKAQIKGFTDADTALKAVTERIQGLPSQQKDAIIQQLGLDGLKPLILAGAEAMARLREEAHSAGAVIDAGIVKRAGDLNKEFERSAKVVDLQLKAAFVDLIPVLTTILGVVAKFAQVLGSAVDNLRSLENRSDSGLARRAETVAQGTGDPEGSAGARRWRFATGYRQQAGRAQQNPGPTGSARRSRARQARLADAYAGRSV
jgi:hypothetical protein